MSNGGESIGSWASVGEDSGLFGVERTSESAREECVVVELPPEGILGNNSSRVAIATSDAQPRLKADDTIQFVGPSPKLQPNVARWKSDSKNDTSMLPPPSRNIIPTRHSVMQDQASACSSDASSWWVGDKVGTTKSMDLDCASVGSRSSNWSVVPRELSSSTASSAARSRIVPSDTASVGSIVSHFEILSLSSGQTVMQCARCKFHNPPPSNGAGGPIFCARCRVALVPNPCLDIDRQIAQSLQEDERRALEEQDERRAFEAKLNFVRMGLFQQCDVVTREMLEFLGQFQGCQTLPYNEVWCKLLTLLKVKKDATTAMLGLGYTFVRTNRDPIDTRKWEFEDGVNVTLDIASAIDQLEESSDDTPVSSAPAEWMFVIPEDSTHISSIIRGWIVGVAPADTGIRRQRKPRIVPLVRFDANMCYDDEISILYNGIWNVLNGYFTVVEVDPTLLGVQPPIQQMDTGN